MSRKSKDNQAQQTEEERLLAELNGEGNGEQSQAPAADGGEGNGDQPVQAPEPEPAPADDDGGSDDVPAVLVNAGTNPRQIGHNVVAPGEAYTLTDQERSNPRLMAKVRHAMRTGFLKPAAK